MTRARKPRAARKPVETNSNICCEQWERFPESARTVGWMVAHRFGHSRVSFSVATLAVKADISTEAAREIVNDAYRWKWIFHGEGGDDIYVGRLPLLKRNWEP